jgi:uncharacterized membrane protein
VPTSRLEAFSDGVFAIAITLLVLEIRVPGQGESLSSALLHRWPSYFAYVSFLTIGIMWVNHHQLFKFVKATDRKLLFVNLGLLMGVAFVPFPTSVVAEFIRNAGQARAAAVLYGVTFTVTAVFWQLLWYWGIRRPDILRDDADRTAMSAIDRSFWVGLPVYAAGTAVALGSPIASIAIFGAIALFYVFERPLARER